MTPGDPKPMPTTKPKASRMVTCLEKAVEDLDRLAGEAIATMEVNAERNPDQPMARLAEVIPEFRDRLERARGLLR